MASSMRDLRLAYTEFHVRDAIGAAAEFAARHGLAAGEPATFGGVTSVVLGPAAGTVVFTSSQVESNAVADYVARHGDGVADIALATPDVRAAFAAAVERGAVPIAAPAPSPRHGGVLAATIGGFGDMVHTLLEPTGPEAPVPGHRPVAPEGTAGLLDTDHFAVCVPEGELGRWVDHYRTVLDFESIFAERVLVGEQAMNSEVVQNAAGDVTFTILEPDSTAAAGQIDDFIARHGGAGVQHVAFRTDDIVSSVRRLRENGVEFLPIPGAYYEALPTRLIPIGHTIGELRELGVLADTDHAGQLFQIFARSTHPRHTFFVEVIERMGARLFGSGNIKALYSAVAQEQATVG